MTLAYSAPAGSSAKLTSAIPSQTIQIRGLPRSCDSEGPRVGARTGHIFLLAEPQRPSCLGEGLLPPKSVAA